MHQLPGVDFQFGHGLVGHGTTLFSNKVFGYYLEVTNSFKDMVPDYYVRKQTLTGAERYITPELKELEDTILGSEDRLTSLEYELFKAVRDHIGENVSRIQRTAKAIAEGIIEYLKMVLVRIILYTFLYTKNMD